VKNNLEKTRTSPENKANADGNEWILESKIDIVSEARDALESRLKGLGWNDDEIGLFPVALGEAVANAVIHGNLRVKKEGGESEESYRSRISQAEKSPEAQAKKVRVELKITADAATVAIYDEGGGFNVGGVPDPKSENRLLETSGRGVDMMRQICDKVEFYPGRVVLYKLREGKKTE